MFVEFIYAVLIVGGSFATPVEDDAHQLLIDPQYEQPCLSYGGICLREAECPEGKLAAVRGLCPLQQRLGVECCHSFSIFPSTCRSRGGECIPSSNQCPEMLLYRDATDCKSGEKCCIYVN